jgi:hypothetical protein
MASVRKDLVCDFAPQQPQSARKHAIVAERAAGKRQRRSVPQHMVPANIMFNAAREVSRLAPRLSDEALSKRYRPGCHCRQCC